MSRRIWWRDDDAGRDDARLERLLALAVARGRPLALAVVPEWLAPATVERVRNCPLATVLQHGVAHADHGVDGDKVELGGAADRGELARRLEAGRRRLEEAFAEQFRPVLVPPWNRIADDVARMAPELGFTGLSCYGAPPGDVPVRRIDVHVDAVDWAAGSLPRPPDAVETALAAACAAAAGAPVGLMTHHQVLGEAHWHDLDRVLAFGQDDPKTHWLSAAEAFAPP